MSNNEIESTGDYRERIRNESFGTALAYLKTYTKAVVRRASWPVGVFVYLVRGSTFQVNRPPLTLLIPEGTTVTYRDHYDMRYEDGSFGVWTPTQADLSACDWEEVDPSTIMF